jgi:hypothetical protein
MIEGLEANPESKTAEFISFLPVLAYDGSSMKQIDTVGIRCQWQPYG